MIHVDLPGPRYSDLKRQLVAKARQVTRDGELHLVGPVSVIIEWTCVRPTSHLSPTGQPKRSAPTRPLNGTTARDITVAVLDALEGQAFLSPMQVVEVRADKLYGPEGLSVTVMVWEDD